MCALITCISNDFCYENIFGKLIQELGNTKDMYVLSVRGVKILLTLKMAKSSDLLQLLSWVKILRMQIHLNYCITIPSDNVARIQEMHLLIGHIICQIVEDKLS